MAAQQARAGVLAVGDGGGRAKREGERRGDAPAREQQLDEGEVLGGEPVPRRRAGQAAGGLDDGGPALGGEVVEPGLPAGHVAVGERDEREQGVVDLLGVAGDGPGLLAHAGDGRGVERGEVAGVAGQRVTQHDGARAALLQGGVVEEGVGLAVDDLVRHGGGLDGVARVQPDRAGLDAGERGDEAVGVHPFAQAVLARLPDERVVGVVEGAGEVLLAADLGREDGGQEVVGAHALELCGAPACRRAAARRRGRG